MKPFLLLGTRDEDAAADNEYDAFLGFTGLDESTLRRVRLERRPLGPVDLDDWSGIFLGGGPFNASDPTAHEVAGAAPGRGRAGRPARRRRRPRLPVPRRLLRHRRGRHPPGRHRSTGPTASRSAGCRSRSPTRDAPTRCSPTCRTRSRRSSGTRRRSATCRRDAVHLASSPACPVQAFRVGRERLRHPVPPRARHRRALHPHRRLPARRLLRARAGRDGQGDGPAGPGLRAAPDAADVRAALRRRALPERWWRPRLTGARV